MNRRLWMRTARLLICVAIVGCSDTATNPRSSSAPQYSQSEDDLDLSKVARYVNAPARPSQENEKAKIGPEGGTLRVGDFEIIVPPGAVDKKTTFRIRLPVDPYGEFAFAEFSPHINFNVPVTIRLPGRSATGKSYKYNIVAGWWSGSEWIPLPTTNTADGRIETQVGHFSWYASCWSRGVSLGGG